MSGLGVDLHPYYQRGTYALPGVEYGWIKMADGAAAYKKVVGGREYTADAHAALFGRLRIPFGGYIFAQLGVHGATAFDVLWRECLRLGGTGVAPACDIEGEGWNPTNATQRGREFCQRARSRNVRPAIYADLSLLQACRPDRWPEQPVIWAPRYSNLKPQDGGRYVGHYDVHQYTSSGTLPGSAGLVDWSQAYTNAHLIGEEDMPLDNNDKTWIRDTVRDTVRYEVLATPHDPADQRTFIFDGRNPMDILVEILNQVMVSNAKADALAMVVAELANHPDITPDAIQEMLTKAVASSIKVSGEFHVVPATQTPLEVSQ